MWISEYFYAFKFAIWKLPFLKIIDDLLQAKRVLSLSFSQSSISSNTNGQTAGK